MKFAARRDDVERMEQPPTEEAEEAKEKVTFFYSFLYNLIETRQISDCGTVFNDRSHDTEVSVHNDGTQLAFNYPLGRQQQQEVSSVPLPNRATSMLGHEIINRLYFQLAQTTRTRTVPTDCIKFSFDHCPLIHRIAVCSINVIFKAIQLGHGDNNDGHYVSYAADELVWVMKTPLSR